jgi:hypothetical protein
VRFGGHEDTPFRVRQLVGSVDGVLKQGAGADEGTVLLGLVLSQPAFDEWTGALSFPTGKDDGPKRIRLSLRTIHDSTLWKKKTVFARDYRWPRDRDNWVFP